MPLPRKRSVLAWATIGILAADIAESSMRLALCESVPEEDRPSICRQPPATVAALAAKFKALYDVWHGLQPRPVPSVQPLTPEGRQLEQEVDAQGL